MNAVVGSRTGGIFCDSECGPCFGVEGRYNIKMVGDLTFTSSCQLFDTTLGFQCPTNVDFRTFFTGINLFTISELEVFKVNF